LIIDPDTELPLPVTLQCFKPVTWQRGKILNGHSRLQAVQLQARQTINPRECLYRLTRRKSSVRRSRWLKIIFNSRAVTHYVKHNTLPAAFPAQLPPTSKNATISK
jgi:hypothetical protein